MRTLTSLAERRDAVTSAIARMRAAHRALVCAEQHLLLTGQQTAGDSLHEMCNELESEIAAQDIVLRHLLRKIADGG